MDLHFRLAFAVGLVFVVGCEAGELSVVPNDVTLRDAGPRVDGGAGVDADGGADVDGGRGPFCGDGVLDEGELCDGDCPTSCPDTACATRALVGSAADCDARCQETPVTTCASGDGCCPSGCSLPDDADCSFDCTDLGAWPADWATEEESALEEMNRHRSTGYDCASGPKMSVPPYVMDPNLRIAARCHSQDMAENDFFSHTGSDGSRFSDRARDAGYTASPRYENIAAGNGTGVASVGQWMRSTTGHCDAVMAADANEVGIGYMRLGGTRWGDYWTAVFGRR